MKKWRIILPVCAGIMAIVLIGGSAMGIFAKRAGGDPGAAGGGPAIPARVPVPGAEDQGSPGADTSLLPGMPEGYELTRGQIEEKESIAEEVLPLFGIMGPGIAYMEGQFVFSARDEEEAGLIAAAYDGELLSFGSGLGVAAIRDGSPYTLGDLLRASADTGNNLPPIGLNMISHIQ